MTDKALTIDELAERHGTSRSTVYSHVLHKNIKTFRIGKLHRISADEVARIEREGLPNLPVERPKKASKSR
jgi:excisionase family DNA binding protein